MNEEFEKSTENSTEKSTGSKKSATDIVIKILTVACVIAAAGLLVVMVMAFLGIGGGANQTPGNVTPQNVTETTVTTTVPETTTLPAVNKTVYAKADAEIKAAASTDSQTVGALKSGESIGFVSVDDAGWCEVIYNNSVCYIHKNYLSTKKPVVLNEEGRQVVNPEQEHWYLVVVDKTRQIPDGYVPELEYVADSDCMMDARVAEYYTKMYEDAAAEGIYLTPFSGYRSYETQESNFNDLVEENMYDYDMTQEEAEAEAATIVLPAGCSEHNLGLAMDIVSADDSFAYSEEYEWLVEHAHEYGFIERYTEDKQDITGIIPEAWHWRFVGVYHAGKIKDAGICLEEYLQSYNVEY